MTFLVVFLIAFPFVVGPLMWVIVKPCLVEMRRCDRELKSSRQARRERMNRELKERRQAADHLRVEQSNHAEANQ